MKAWLVGAAVALLAGAPALAQTSSSSGASQPSATQQQSGSGDAMSGASQNDQTQTPRKHHAARSHRAAHTQTAQGKSQGSDDQTTEQLNRDELQRLQQSSR